MRLSEFLQNDFLAKTPSNDSELYSFFSFLFCFDDDTLFDLHIERIFMWEEILLRELLWDQIEKNSNKLRTARVWKLIKPNHIQLVV